MLSLNAVLQGFFLFFFARGYWRTRKWHACVVFHSVWWLCWDNFLSGLSRWVTPVYCRTDPKKASLGTCYSLGSEYYTHYLGWTWSDQWGNSSYHNDTYMLSCLVRLNCALEQQNALWANHFSIQRSVCRCDWTVMGNKNTKLGRSTTTQKFGWHVCPLNMHVPQVLDCICDC